MTAVIVVHNWERFQHYKDRDPPWIKLYRDLLTSESWVLGNDDSRLVQVAITLLAARYHNATPLNFTLLRKVASLDLTDAKFTTAINHLAATKFLSIQEVDDTCKQGASSVLATCTSETEQSRAEQSRVRAREDARDDDEVSRETPEQIADELLARRRGRQRAGRLPDDFSLTPERRVVAEAERLPAERTFAKFCDYWRSASGERARKLDWDATWRNWCRTEADRSRSNVNGAAPLPKREPTPAEITAAQQQAADDNRRRLAKLGLADFGKAP